jgi:hypothetical protein
MARQAAAAKVANVAARLRLAGLPHRARARRTARSARGV